MATPETIQQQPPERLRKIYNYLRGQNKVRSETYEDFEEKMQDPARLEKVYNYLKGENKVRSENFDQFQEKMGLKKKVEGLPGSIPLAPEADPQTLQVPDTDGSPESSPVLESGLTEEQERERNLAELTKAPVASEQPRTQDKAVIDDNIRDFIIETEKRVHPENYREDNPLVSFGKSLWNVLANQIPSAIASTMALVSKTPASFKVPEEYQSHSKIHQKKWLEYAQKQQQEGGELTKDLVNTMDKVKDPIDALNYTFAAAGQATGQIPLSVVTGGASSAVQEIGTVYLGSVQKIAKEKGISVNDVIDQGLDETAYALTYGLAAGMLDRVGARAVMGTFSKQAFKQSLRDRAKLIATSTSLEGGTEYVQTGLEQLGIGQGAGQSFSQALEEAVTNPELRKERLEGLVQGLIGGTTLSSAGVAFNAMREARTPDTLNDQQNAATQPIPSAPDTSAGQQDAGAQTEPISTPGPGQDLQGLKRSQQTVQGLQSTTTGPESGAYTAPVTKQTDAAQTAIPGPPVSSPSEQRADIPTEEGRDIPQTEEQVPDGGAVDQAPDSGAEVMDYSTRLKEIEDINSSINKLRSENPKEFKKNGEPKANSKIKGSYRALVDMRDDRVQGIQSSMEQEFAARAENESEISRAETQKLNEDFEARQKELSQYIPEDELQDEAIFDRIESLLKEADDRVLSDEEVAFLNENAFKPSGFTFDQTGSLVKQSNTPQLDDTTTTPPPAQPDTEDTSAVPPVDESVEADETSAETVPPGDQPFPVGAEVEFEWLGRDMVGTVDSYKHKRAHIRTRTGTTYPIDPAKLKKPDPKKALPRDANEIVKHNSKRKKPIGIVGDPSSGFIFETDLGDKIVSQFKKWMTSKGWLPKYVFDRMTKMNAEISDFQTQIFFTVKDFKAAIKAEYGKDVTDEQITDLNLYLQGKQNLNPIPQKTMDVLDVMRAQIDNLSTRFINEGIVSGDLAATFTKNLGLYLTRSYRKHDDPFWSEFVPPEVRNKAEGFIRYNAAKKGQQISPEEVEGLINFILYDPQAPMAVLKGSKLGSKDLSILKKRGDIAPEIRALMGQYSDPLLNYARSVTKMATMMAKHHFLTDVRANGMGKFLFDKPIGKYSVKLATEGSKTMAPLNGLYTTKEIAEAFSEYDKLSDTHPFNSFLMKAISWVKKNKTVFSIQTHIRNVVGNGGLFVMNGHWRLNNFGTAIPVAWAQLYDSSESTRQQYLRYVRLGIVKDSASAGELRAIIKDVRNGEDFFETLGDRSFKKALRRIDDTAQRAYQAEDDMFKIFAFENELARYKKAYPDMPQDQLEEKVAEIVRTTMPTWSRVPRAVKVWRGQPFVGSFVSFPAEIFRTTYNTMELAWKEIGNPETRDIGVQRMTGIMLAMSIPTIASMVTMQALGMDWDDDEDLRKFAAPWQKDSEFLYLDRKGDEYTIVDMGYSDPHNYIKRPIYAFLAGENLMDSGIDAMASAARPFLDENLLTARLLDLTRNQDEQGDRVYNPDAPIGDQFSAMYAHLWPITEPGTIASIRRVKKGILGESSKYGKEYSTMEEVVSVVTGQKAETKNLTQSLLYRAFDLKDRMEATEKDYFRVIKNQEATEDQKANATRIRDAAIAKIAADAKDIYLSAIRLGVDPKIARQYMARTKNFHIWRATAGAK